MNKSKERNQTELQGFPTDAGFSSDAGNTGRTSRIRLSAKKGLVFALVAVLLIVSAAVGNFTDTDAASGSKKAKSMWVMKSGKCHYYLDSTGTQTAKFVKKSGKWYYYTYDKTAGKFKKKTFTKERNTIQKLKGKYFYVKKDGSVRMKKGWQKINGKKKILVGADASVSAKYEKKGSKWIYKEYKKYKKTVDGTKKTVYGFVTVKKAVRTLSDGKLYYFNKNGVKTTASGWKSISTKKRVYVGKKGYVTKIQTRKNASAAWKQASGVIKSSGKVANEKAVCDHNWVDQTKLTYHEATYKTGTVYVDADGNEYTDNGYWKKVSDGMSVYVYGDVAPITNAIVGSDGKTYYTAYDYDRAEYYNPSLKIVGETTVYVHYTGAKRICMHCTNCPVGPRYTTEWHYTKVNPTQDEVNKVYKETLNEFDENHTNKLVGHGALSFFIKNAFVVLTEKTGTVIDTPAYYTKTVTGSYCTKCGKTK